MTVSAILNHSAAGIARTRLAEGVHTSDQFEQILNESSLSDRQPSVEQRRSESRPSGENKRSKQTDKGSESSAFDRKIAEPAAGLDRKKKIQSDANSLEDRHSEKLLGHRAARDETSAQEGQTPIGDRTGEQPSEQPDGGGSVELSIQNTVDRNTLVLNQSIEINHRAVGVGNSGDGSISDQQASLQLGLSETNSTQEADQADGQQATGPADSELKDSDDSSEDQAVSLAIDPLSSSIERASDSVRQGAIAGLVEASEVNRPQRVQQVELTNQTAPLAGGEASGEDATIVGGASRGGGGETSGDSLDSDSGSRQGLPSALANGLSISSSQAGFSTQLDVTAGVSALPIVATVIPDVPIEVAPSQTALPDQDAERTEANITRVMRGMRGVINQNGGAMTLRLSPPEMGIVRIEMQIESGHVSAQIHAEHESARSLLTQQLGQLRDSLEGHGLRVDRLGVTTLTSENATLSSDHEDEQSTNDGRSRGRGMADGRQDEDGHEDKQREDQSKQRRANFERLLNNVA